jgi:hypothetical protein
MDAEFFCLNAHVESAGALVRRLTRSVDPSVAMRVWNFDTEDNDERAEAGRRYTKLLHASIPPERDLSIEVNNSLQLFSQRVYIRIYWPLVVEGVYRYPGIDGWVHGAYRTEYARQFHGGGRGLEWFLPALAVRDRMVLVPRGQNDPLEQIGTGAPEQPLERGVIEVEFADRDDVGPALDRVGRELRAELRNELLAYQSFHLSEPEDLDTVSAYLAVPPGLLRRAVREEAGARELIYRQLRVSAAPEVVTTEVQTRLSIVVENPSDIDLGTLDVQVRGPGSGFEINPERVRIQLAAGDEVRADFSVAALREGEFVLEVLFVDVDLEVPRDMLPVQQLWITSRRD